MFQKRIHKVKFYPSADDFTQAPLVMLVTNIMSVSHWLIQEDIQQAIECTYVYSETENHFRTNDFAKNL